MFTGKLTFTFALPHHTHRSFLNMYTTECYFITYPQLSDCSFQPSFNMIQLQPAFVTVPQFKGLLLTYKSWKSNSQSEERQTLVNEGKVSKQVFFVFTEWLPYTCQVLKLLVLV